MGRGSLRGCCCHFKQTWPNRPQLGLFIAAKLWFNIDRRPPNSVNKPRLEELSEFIPPAYHVDLRHHIF